MINKLIIYKFFLSRTSLNCLIIAYGDSNYFVPGQWCALVAMYVDQVFEYDHTVLRVIVDVVKNY